MLSFLFSPLTFLNKMSASQQPPTAVAPLNRDDFNLLQPLHGIVSTLLRGDPSLADTIGPAIYELDKQYQHALKWLDAVPDKDVPLDEMQARVDAGRAMLAKRRDAFTGYQQLLRDMVAEAATDPQRAAAVGDGMAVDLAAAAAQAPAERQDGPPSDPMEVTAE
ncbi:hypothetical protein AMAG_10399 [Allomyces macrogynus ATCC 38327]|uniref:Mediator of RNA polymerase II transcription subunit 9 n=1 Tax=Allomyces macrogynus (strain ATCC 38327) TaxID=578462 RepID=A0A0L0SUY7_ALLM3|nr:hypothetical protein AMAG_10399 [Allomyces macrogynus ATCC 38327]|eukprot:KNE66149.1 hypothetical protein AMAG_10399 [Allomyces macrogynus ATCC 38327]